MRNTIAAMCAIGLCFLAPLRSAEKPEETAKRMQDATAVVADAKNMGVAKELFKKSKCAVVVPSMKKGGFVLAAQYGKGFATCKNASGAYATLSAVKLEGGSFGLQAGGQSSDVLMLVMNDKGVAHLASSKFTLGGDASVAAGPVGRETTAQTDATMAAEVLSWSKTAGVFGGLSLKGSTLRGDDDANAGLYPGAKVTAELHTKQSMPAPASASAFLKALNQYVK